MPVAWPVYQTGSNIIKVNFAYHNITITIFKSYPIVTIETI